MSERKCDWCGREYDDTDRRACSEGPLFKRKYFCSPKCRHEAQEAGEVPEKGEGIMGALFG